MLNEQASSSLEQPIWRPQDFVEAPPDPFAELREHVSDVMHIQAERSREEVMEAGDMMLANPNHQLLISYHGTLKIDSEAAYDQLDAALTPDDRLALFRHNDGDDVAEAPHVIHIIQGRVEPVEGRPWINLLMFLLTLASVWFVGANYGISTVLEDQPFRESEMLFEWRTPEGEVIAMLPRLGQLWRGYPYALSLMLILGAHELGHYFAARRHKHSVSLPYFIPMPLTFLGTMGAFIRSREPMRNRKVLIDVGAAGPLAGLVFAVPIVFIGLATSPVRVVTGDGLREGNSLLYAFAKIVTKGTFYPTETMDVFINQMALAGWLGLLVTALNLIPVGQLDGGHVLYSLFGRRARRFYIPVMAVMIGLALTPNGQVWILWVLLLLFLGRVYAQPLDDITPLDRPRRWVAILTLAVLVLVFVPIPFTAYTLEGEPAPQNNVFHMEPPAPVVLSFGSSTALDNPAEITYPLESEQRSVNDENTR